MKDTEILFPIPFLLFLFGKTFSSGRPLQNVFLFHIWYLQYPGRKCNHMIEKDTKIWCQYQIFLSVVQDFHSGVRLKSIGTL
jgi:hypothetical protein